MVRPARRLLLTALAAVALAGAARPAPAASFDFFVLSLSWSPSWCSADRTRADDRQCRTGSRFIAHGLWPQNERGWPEFCPSSEPNRIPSSMMSEIGDIMPSIGLAGHEWRKHGTCSGLSQRAYFQLLRKAYDKVRLPPVIFDGRISRKISVADIEALVAKANPGMSTEGVAVTCAGGTLDEIRICLTPSLDYRDCPEVNRNSCRLGAVSIPPATR